MNIEPENPLLAHIRACQSAALPGTRIPFRIGPAQVGYVEPDLAERLAPHATRVDGALVLDPAAAPRLNEIAAAALSDRPRFELFDVFETPDTPPLTVIDRGYLPAFGMIGVGAHVNGIVRRADGLHLWIAIRSKTKKLDPGKADNVVAGGVPAGLTPWQAMLKEAAEEAALPEALAAHAREVSRIAYAMSRPEGLRRDLLVCYDLPLPETFTPQAADGEVDHFELWPIPRIIQTLRDTQDFKFNVTLVLIDFLIRHSLLPEAEAKTLRAALDEGKV